MAFCAKCGAQMADGTTFCGACGAAASSPSSGPVATSSVASTGLTSNMAGALAYFTFIPAIIFLVADPYKNDRFIRFHSFQSIFYNVAAIAISIGWAILTLILGLLSMGVLGALLGLVHLLIVLAFFLGWLFLTYKAYQNELFQAPIIGPLAAKQAGL
jgi:uncharacterized membrane protein